MKLSHFINLTKIANDPKEYADSLILIYTDNCDVRGPFFGEDAQLDAYEAAYRSERPFKFQTWNHKG